MRYYKSTAVTFEINTLPKVTLVPLSRLYSINATERSSHSSRNNHHITERTHVPRLACYHVFAMSDTMRRLNTAKVSCQ